MFRQDRAIESRSSEHEALLREFFAAWGLPPQSRNPCPLPASLDAAALQDLRKHTFWMSPKADGFRFQLMLTIAPDGDPIAVLVDRQLHMWEVEITGCRDMFTKRTLLDGELVSGKLLLFDAVQIAGQDYKNKTMARRLHALHNLVAESGTTADVLQEARQITSCAGEIALVVKETRLMSEAKLMRQPQPFAVDGWILTRDDAPIGNGTTRNVFKWKAMHTVDCLLNPPRLLDGKTGVLQTINVRVEGPASNDGVHECEIVGEPPRWKVLQPRNDKKNPNTVTTYERTLRSVRENVTEDALFALHDEC